MERQHCVESESGPSPVSLRNPIIWDEGRVYQRGEVAATGAEDIALACKSTPNAVNTSDPL